MKKLIIVNAPENQYNSKAGNAHCHSVNHLSSLLAFKLIYYILIVSLCLSSFGVYASDLEAVETSAGVGAKAAIVMETMTGRVLFAQNAEERMPIASTTKIMTALLALEQPDIDAVFTVDEKAIMVEGSSMGLQKGDKVSLRVLAQGMLLPSGNDAANAAAHRIAGSIPAFATLMNDRAKELGLKNTSFETPSGLDAENHYSTARDMALLAREALQNQEFAEICSQYKIRTSYGDPPYDRWLTNHNRLLNSSGDVVGVKTGFTKKAGRCLVSAAVRDGVGLIVVTLNSPNDWKVHQDLYDQYFATVRMADLSEGIRAVKVPVTGGVEAEVAAIKTDIAEMPIPVNGARIEYKIMVEQFVYAPVRSGQYLGEAKIMVDGEEAFRITLAAERDIPLLHEYKEKKSITDMLKELFSFGA